MKTDNQVDSLAKAIFSFWTNDIKNPVITYNGVRFRTCSVNSKLEKDEIVVEDDCENFFTHSPVMRLNNKGDLVEVKPFKTELSREEFDQLKADSLNLAKSYCEDIIRFYAYKMND